MSGLFRQPWLLGLAACAGLAAAALAAWGEARRRRLIALFATPTLAARLFPVEAGAARRRKYSLRAAALVLVLVALAGPQWGVELQVSKFKTTQAVLALDLSKSMLTEDVKPSRIERAKAALSLVLDEMDGQRAGVVAFAGDAFVQCPLTTDLGAVREVLRGLKAGTLPVQGTSLERALEAGTRLLAKYPGRKALVLATDGEARGGDALAAARAANDAGVSLVILGVGTPEGAPIPLKDADGHITGYMKDRKGQTVVSRLGESGLVQLAALTRGAYWRLSPDDSELPAVLRALRASDATESAAAAGARYRNRYRLPLAAAIFLSLVELLWPEVPRRHRTGSLAGAPAALAVLLLAAAAPSARAAPREWSLWRGNRAWKRGDADTALKEYEKRAKDGGRPGFNAGAARYALGDYEGAENQFGQLTQDLRAAGRDGVRGNDAYYDLGNALYKQQKLPEAAEAYKKCLLIDPSDQDCRHNLVLALRPQDQKQKPQDDKKKQDQKNKDKDQNNPPPGQRPRSQGMSREDAERILQAAAERERDARKNQPPQAAQASAGSEDDW